MKTLDLVLKHKWYDLIANGDKKEEYRELKPYWCKRIMKCIRWCGRGSYVLNDITNVFHCLYPKRCENTNDFIKISGGYTHVTLHRGYTSTTMTFKINNISIGKGRPEWGAPVNKEVFIIKLGKRL